MKCTVVMPVYNAGAPLGPAIESILRQVEFDFEFLIIDDCSSDSSPEVIRRYASSDNRIRPLFHSVNNGLAATLNEAMEKSCCELVVRMDQDDLALPDRLGIQLDFMADHPEVAVAGTFVYHMGRTPDRDHLIRLPVSHEEIVQSLPQANCLYHPSVIMRRDNIRSLGGYRAVFKNAEDYDLWLRAGRVFRLANIPVPLLRYRFSTTGMTLGKKWQQAVFARMAVLSYRHPEWAYHQLETEARADLEEQGKGWFLEQVAQGTIRELVRLGLRRDAMQVFWQFARQLEAKRMLRLAWQSGIELSGVRT